jgi:hypothetical protein
MDNAKNNYRRMMHLIDEVFATRNDPGQIQVTAAERHKLSQIHPSTLAELSDKNGPLIWVLMIPTTAAIMREFLDGKLSEKELLDRTPVGGSYDCVYLCSATALPEARGRGETKQLCLQAIAGMMKDHPITALFVWPFTKEGERLAESVARAAGLKLLKKKEV